MFLPNSFLETILFYRTVGEDPKVTENPVQQSSRDCLSLGTWIFRWELIISSYIALTTQTRWNSEYQNSGLTKMTMLN